MVSPEYLSPEYLGVGIFREYFESDFSLATTAISVIGLTAMHRGLESTGMAEVSVVEYTEVLRKNIVRLRVKKIKAKNMHLKE